LGESRTVDVEEVFNAKGAKNAKGEEKKAGAGVIVQPVHRDWLLASLF